MVYFYILLTVEGSVGDIGGSKSHEFHIPSEAGENELIVCESCKTGYNKELVQEGKVKEVDHCMSCGGKMHEVKGMEVCWNFFNITEMPLMNIQKHRLDIHSFWVINILQNLMFDSKEP